jgi:hypothetical protein
MKTSTETNKLFPALFKAKQELGSVSKGADNPFFKSSYADLNTHIDVAEPVLAKFGLMLLQPSSSNNGVSTVESVIVHAESGQWVSSEMALVLAKNSMQDAGSAVTYARRYTLGALLSMKAVDDDGETAVGRGKSTAPATKANTGVVEAAVAEAKKEHEAKKTSFRKPTAPSPATTTADTGWDS